jgi:hypothetical protein
MSKSVVEITGFKELQAKIKLLADDKDKKRELLLLLRQVAKPTLEAAKAFVPKKTLKLQKSLGFISSKAINPTVLVGPRVKGQNKGWYGHMVHEGHNIYAKGFKRKRKGGGVNDYAAKSRTKAQPYMTEAYAATEGLVTADAEKKVTAFIQRRIDKLSTNV